MLLGARDAKPKHNKVARTIRTVRMKLLGSDVGAGRRPFAKMRLKSLIGT